jgi:hypothetical protein
LPAAVTVLLLCLQLQKFWLGIILVLCFSIGLALTLLASGAVAAWGVRHMSRRWPGFDTLARRLPCIGLSDIRVGRRCLEEYRVSVRSQGQDARFKRRAVVRPGLGRRTEDENLRISPKQAGAHGYIQPIHFRDEQRGAGTR